MMLWLIPLIGSIAVSVTLPTIPLIVTLPLAFTVAIFALEVDQMIPSDDAPSLVLPAGAAAMPQFTIYNLKMSGFWL